MQFPNLKRTAVRLRGSVLLGITTTAIALLLAACGGGGAADAGSPTSTPAGNPPAVPFDAVGSSARTVSLAWTPPADAASVAIERRAGNSGDYSRVATLDAHAASYLDDGLAANTTYSYRLVAADTAGGSPRVLADRSVTTSAEQGVVTAIGAAQGDAKAATVGSGGAELVSADGQFSVVLPAGALAADTAASLQPVANTAPDGRGVGLKLRLGAAPRQALTLKLRYDAEHDADADALRIAVQRTDGSWTSLPLAAIDKTSRTLTSMLPAGFLSTAAAPAPGLKAAAADNDVNVGIEFHIVKYLAFRLKPELSRLKVKQTLELTPYARVRGYETQIGSCVQFEPGIEACVMQPMMELRQIAFGNVKGGYKRQWFVYTTEGGDATHGTIAPHGDVGGLYTAPVKVPQPSQALVRFRSEKIGADRMVTMQATVDIWDDSWTGTMTAIDGPSSAGTTLTSTAKVTWQPDAAASTETVKVYRPHGTLEVAITDNDCTATVTPNVQPVSSDTRLVELRVDERTSPATYKAKLITFWTARIDGFCPKGGASQETRSAGWGWEVEGTVGGDGRRIEGFDTTEDGYRLEWSFTR